MIGLAGRRRESLNTQTDQVLTGENMMKKWQCVVCGFIYDETVGMPGEGIKAGTRWEDIPESWACPECGVAKSDFEMVQI